MVGLTSLLAFLLDSCLAYCQFTKYDVDRANAGLANIGRFVSGTPRKMWPSVFFVFVFFLGRSLPSVFAVPARVARGAARGKGEARQRLRHAVRAGRRLLSGVSCHRASAKGSCKGGSGPPALLSLMHGQQPLSVSLARPPSCGSRLQILLS